MRDVRAGLSEEGRAGLLVQHNSGMVFRALGDEAAAQGVILAGLDEAIREYPDLVRKYNVNGVPKIVIDDTKSILGVASEDDVITAIC